MTLAEQFTRARKTAFAEVKGLRPSVKRIQLAPYVDAGGENAIQVVVILDEGTSSAERNYAKLKPIEERIRQAIAGEQIGLWPYFWFRTASEQRAAKLVAA